MGKISYQTARELQKRGFAQPAPKRGQHWYTMAEILCHICWLRGKFYWLSDDRTCFESRYLEFGKDLIFAPSAADILTDFRLRFGGNLALTYNDYTQTFCANEQTDSVRGSGGRRGILRSHKIMEEALALAWIAACDGQQK